MDSVSDCYRIAIDSAIYIDRVLVEEKCLVFILIANLRLYLKLL